MFIAIATATAAPTVTETVVTAGTNNNNIVQHNKWDRADHALCGLILYMPPFFMAPPLRSYAALQWALSFSLIELANVFVELVVKKSKPYIGPLYVLQKTFLPRTVFIYNMEFGTF